MKVVNLKKDNYTVYIGRGSVFGNPYPLGSMYGGRKQVMELYEEYARTNVKLLKAIYALPREAILGCFCKPLACHGDIILKLWEEECGKEITMTRDELIEKIYNELPEELSNVYKDVMTNAIIFQVDKYIKSFAPDWNAACMSLNIERNVT